MKNLHAQLHSDATPRVRLYNIYFIATSSVLASGYILYKLHAIVVIVNV